MSQLRVIRAGEPFRRRGEGAGGHLLAKPDAPDRVHAVIFAYESGLAQPGGPAA